MGPMGDEQRRELEREVVTALRQHEEPIGGSELLTVVEDASERELRFAVSELLDKHRITITKDWEYELDG